MPDSRKPAAPDPAQVLWRLVSHGGETYSGRDRYWWQNHDRLASAPEHCLVQYTIQGSMTLILHGEHHRVPARHAALFCYSEDSSYGLTAADTLPYRNRWVVLHGAGLRQHWDLLRQRAGPVLGPDDGERITSAMDDLIHRASPRAVRDPFTAAIAVQHFVARLGAIQSGPSREAGSADDAIDRMLANPQYPWSLKELAHEAGCSREHLTRRFKLRTGSSPADWLNRQRLTMAMSLLRSTALPVAAVAEQAGFSSTHTLARQLRRATGCSPTRYREPDDQ